MPFDEEISGVEFGLLSLATIDRVPLCLNRRGAVSRAAGGVLEHQNGISILRKPPVICEFWETLAKAPTPNVAPRRVNTST